MRGRSRDSDTTRAAALVADCDSAPRRPYVLHLHAATPAMLLSRTSRALPIRPPSPQATPITPGMCAIFYAPREFLNAAYAALEAQDAQRDEEADAMDAVQEATGREADST